MSETPEDRDAFMLGNLSRGTLEDAGLACESGKEYETSYKGHIRLTSTPKGEAGLVATDGHRLHVTRPALEEGASHVCWLPVRSLEALAFLERHPDALDALEVGSWGTKDKLYLSSHEGEFQVRFPAQNELYGPELATVLGNVQMFGNGARDIVAIERSWKAHKLGSFRPADLVVVSGAFPLSGEPRSATTLRVWKWPPSYFDPVQREKERAEVLEKIGTDRRIVLRASYLKDAIRFVSNGGDACTVCIPASGKSGFGEGPLVLASGSRLALVMPMNASIA